MSSDIEALEEKLAGMLRMDGKMDAKNRADFLKTTAAALEKCKQRRVSLSSDVSARALLALIGTWDTSIRLEIAVLETANAVMFYI